MRRPTASLTLPLLLTALLSTTASAAAELSYRVFTTDNGLPQISVHAIDQTPDGYLWIATLDGLVRFDGQRMIVFNHAEVPEILSNRILALRVDHEGSLWAGTEDAGVIRMKDGVFRSFGVADGLPDALVDALQEDTAGHMWIATQRGRVRFDGTRFRMLETAALRPGASGAYWREDGARIFEPDGSPYDYSWGGGKAPALFFHEPRGGSWAYDSARGLLKLERGQVTRVDAPDRVGIASTPGRLAVTHGRSGRMWLMLGGRLSLLENGAWRTFSAEVPEAAKNPFAMFEDAEGSLWIGGEGGLVQAFPTPVRTIVPEETGPQRNFYPIAEDRGGQVWAASRVNLFRVVGGRFVRQDESYVTAIRPEPDGAVLLAAAGRGVMRRGPGGGAETIYRGSEPITDILRDRAGTLWVATQGCIIRIDPAGRITRLGVVDGLAGAWVTALLESASGGLWVGCYGGLSRIDGGRVTTWKGANGLSSEKIRSLHEDERGVLWIGTYDNGITRFAGGKMIAIRKRDGLFDNGAFAIVDDGLGRFWISCNRGVYSVPRAELDAFADSGKGPVRSRAFGRADGMLNAECNGGYQPSGFRKSDGTLWFPTQQGIAVVDPRAMTASAVAPNVVIESIASDRRDHAVAPAVELDPSETRLEVRFTATTFVRPEQARFRYRMDKLDDDWVDGGTARSVSYAHLPPGRYVFRVAASNADGVWSENGASVAIRVNPAWWQTLWFRAGALAAGFAFIGLGVQSRFVRLRRRRAEQDRFARQLIASQEAERKRIAAELHDGIGQTLVVIRSRAQMGLRHEAGTADARRQMQEIVEATGAGIEEVRKVAYNLRPYQLDRLGLTRAIEALVEQTAESSGVAITSQLDPLDGVFAPDDEIGVYRIVQEALSNLLRHAQASRASVRARRSEGTVEIAVEDHGRGFDPALLPADRPGMGLSGIAERARILHGRHAVVSSPGRGTRVVVWLPVRGAAS